MLRVQHTSYVYETLILKSNLCPYHSPHICSTMNRVQKCIYKMVNHRKKVLKIQLFRGFKLPTQMKDVQCYANWFTCVTYRFSGPLASALIINYGARVVMMLGAALMATGTLISGFVPNIYFLYMTMGVITGLYFLE